MGKKIYIIIILASILIIGGLFFTIRHITKSNNVESTTNEFLDEKKTAKDFNLIYTNNTNSKSLNSVKMGLYNKDDETYYDVVKVDVPDKYLISNLEYVSGTEELFGVPDYANYTYTDYNYEVMEDTVDMIPDIVTDYAITKFSVSDYISSSIDKATVLNIELFPEDCVYSSYEDEVFKIKDKNVYCSYYVDGILGPSIGGKIILNGEEKVSESDGDNKYILETSNCSELDYSLSNPNITEENHEEYLNFLMDMLTFE